MAVYALTINGASKALIQDSFRISETANRRGTCSFSIVSLDGSFRTEIDDELEITEDGDVIFGGLISAPSEQRAGAADWGAIVQRCEAVDYNSLIDGRVLNISIPAGTLKAALLLLEPYLTGYGVALDVAQVNGPTLPAFQLYFTTLRRAFEILSDMTDYVFEIDYTKTLRMFAPSAVAAPFTVTNSNGKAIGDVTAEPTRENFSNRVLILGGTGTLVVTENLTAPGGTPDVVLNYTLVGHAGYVTYGGNFETLDVPGMGATWEWTTTNGTTTISRTTGDPSGAVAITYTGHFPKLCVGGDDPQLWTLADIRERIIPYPEVFEVAVLQEIADKTVARTSVERKRVQYVTHDVGIHPGMTQTITVTERDLSGTFTITDVTISHVVGQQCQRSVTALEGDTYLMDSWQDDAASWGENVTVGGGAQVMGTALPSLPSSAAPPFKAVQFNNSGAFGGSAHFTFDKDTVSLIMGEGSVITAADPSHCFIFGPDNEIAD